MPAPPYPVPVLVDPEPVLVDPEPAVVVVSPDPAPVVDGEDTVVDVLADTGGVTLGDPGVVAGCDAGAAVVVVVVESGEAHPVGALVAPC